jgi:hypothetical protein
MTPFKLWTVVFCLALGSVEQAEAAIMGFGFGSEPGNLFSSFNDGGSYAIDTTTGALRISKPADDGSLNPHDFVTAGVLSTFTFTGDFTVNVNFSLFDLPNPAGSEQLNESLLRVTSDSGSYFEVLRFAVGGRSLTEAYSDPYVSFGDHNSSLTSGVYRISRVGSTISGWIAPSDESSFLFLGSAMGYNDPMRVQLFAAQGMNSGDRSTTGLDIGFDGLTIEADQFQGVVPEPASFVIWGGIGITGLIAGLYRRQKQAVAS